MLVGEFSRLTHLTTKALHHYHQLGLLEPAWTDPVSGYRYYTPDQVERAHLVRRLRAARMPLAQIRAALAAVGAEREERLLDHLDVLRAELLETAAAVTSLRALLGRVEPTVHHGELPAQRCLAVAAEVTPADLGEWCAVVYPQLVAAARTGGLPPEGPCGALYEPSWFSGDGGKVTAFLPVAASTSRDGAGAAGVAVLDLPGGSYATAVHEGPCSELDLTYGRLGRHVLAAGTDRGGPVREHYLVTTADTRDPRALRTEVCWPVSAA
ncbi:DNA-binding transcriptional MerR regulator [Kineococcus rhizosphaerae]|uniref:DNA-binding transcriptional MerR regulator n=2 Tax=Kineococcus rhizosphaerae TaxID=559628 RepID=A0A2T0R2X6_9ACTN|nr:DNA-binding transcriptional MerR regulator [Kineococcus rhizosphaerae]